MKINTDVPEPEEPSTLGDETPPNTTTIKMDDLLKAVSAFGDMAFDMFPIVDSAVLSLELIGGQTEEGVPEPHKFGVTFSAVVSQRAV